MLISRRDLFYNSFRCVVAARYISFGTVLVYLAHQRSEICTLLHAPRSTLLARIIFKTTYEAFTAPWTNSVISTVGSRLHRDAPHVHTRSGETLLFITRCLCATTSGPQMAVRCSSTTAILTRGELFNFRESTPLKRHCFSERRKENAKLNRVLIFPRYFEGTSEFQIERLFIDTLCLLVSLIFGENLTNLRYTWNVSFSYEFSKLPARWILFDERKNE